MTTPAPQPDPGAAQPDEADLWPTVGLPLWRVKWRLLLVLLLCGALGYGVALLVPERFTARTSFLPPQSSSSGSAALASLRGLAALAGVPAPRTPADQYAALVGSETVQNKMIDRFGLQQIYESKFRVDARKTLGQRTRVSIGKKDGLIAVEVEDNDPKRAADMANQYLHELREFSSQLTLSEAKQRRVFFEGLLRKTHLDLTRSQEALQSSGFDQRALRAEPKAAAEAFARARAEISAAEVRLQMLRGSLTDEAPEVQRVLAQLGTLRSQARALEASQAAAPAPAEGPARDGGYVSRFREFKYQEAMFEMLSRQFEAARLDEAREGVLFQVVDAALLPERRSFPKRSIFALVGGVLGLTLAAALVLIRAQRTNT